MKPTKISFLFLCFLSILLVSFSIQKAYSQEKADSLGFYSKLALEPNTTFDLSNAFNYFSKQSEIELKRKDTSRVVYCLFNIASIEYKKGFYTDSESSAVKALKLLEKANKSAYNLTLMKSLYNHLGIMYKETGNPEKAIELYNKSFNFSKTAKDSAVIYNNISNVYKSINETLKAKDELLKAYELLPKIRDTLSIALIMGNLGDIYSELNKEEAISLHMKALELREHTGSVSKIYTSYNQLTKHFIRKNDTSKANIYATKAYEIANKLGSNSYKLDALSLLVDLKNYEYINEFKSLSDKNTELERKSLNKFALMKYEKTKEILRANEAELKNEKLKINRLLWLTLAIIITLLSIFLYFILKSKHKKDKIKQAYLKEVEFSKKVHDELANDVSDLMNYVENDVVISNEKKARLLDIIEDIYLRARDISTETASIDLVHFQESLANLLLQHNKAGTKVVINDINTINWNKVQDHKKMIVYRCLQELMVNMKKHSKAKLVSIIFKEQNDKKEIRYVDDGIGFDVEGTKLNGLANVESRIKSIQGTFNFTTSEGNGLKATLMFNS